MFPKSWQKDRFNKLSSGYVFDRWIFSIYMVLVFAFLFFVAYSNNFEMDFYICDTMPGEFCKNPFYNAADWKNVEFLGPGEYGNDTRPVIQQSIIVIVLGFIVSIALNHFGYNKGKKILKKVIK